MQTVLKRMTLADAIKEAMDGRRNIWLAEKTGIHKSKISQILNGLRPTQKELEKINKALSIDLSLEG